MHLVNACLRLLVRSVESEHCFKDFLLLFFFFLNWENYSAFTVLFWIPTKAENPDFRFWVQAVTHVLSSACSWPVLMSTLGDLMAKVLLCNNFFRDNLFHFAQSNSLTFQHSSHFYCYLLTWEKMDWDIDNQGEARAGFLLGSIITGFR